MRAKDVEDEDFHFAVKGHPLQRDAKKKTYARLVNVFRKRCKVHVVESALVAGESLSYISTGFQPLDDVISGSPRRDKKTKRFDVVPGTGRGLPRGRIVEVYGEEAVAKTGLCLAIIADAQRQGQLCAFIDAEHALDPDFATKTFDVDMNELMVVKPESGEEGLQGVLEAVKTGFDLVVVDSVSALVPEDELRGKAALGGQARMMSSVCRKLAGLVSRRDAVVIFINQVRTKIGVFFGDPTVTSGGNALKFYASVRLCMSKRQAIKLPSKTKGRPCQIGQELDIHVVKNKIAPPHQHTLCKMYYADGFHFPKTAKAQGVELRASKKVVELSPSKKEHKHKHKRKRKRESRRPDA
jgi:recombination protein RecA